MLPAARGKIVGIEEQVISVGALKWFYREAKPISETDKPPVLLLHGLPSQSYSWLEVMEPLAQQGFRAIAPDWIGFGFSGKPDRRDFAYTPDAFIEALAAFLQALEINRFYLVVQGFLGSVGLQYAARHPEQIERLAILNAPVTPDAKLPWKLQQLGLPFLGDVLTQDPLLVDRTLEGGSGYVIADANLDVYRRPFLKSSDAGRSLLYTVRNLGLKQAMTEIEAGFRNFTQPTLIIWGMEDPWLSFTDAENFAKPLQNAQLVKLSEGKHYPQEHWAGKVSDALIPFLRRKEV